MTNKLAFRYDIENIPSMLRQLSHEEDDIRRAAFGFVKPFEKNRVKRKFPLVFKRSFYSKRGNRWHYVAAAYKEEDLTGENMGFFAYMQYNSKNGKGILCYQWLNNHSVYFDFTPHALMRYRQRYLNERNINVTFEEQIRILFDNMEFHSINIDENLIMLFTKQGVFYGEYIGRAWAYYKTFIAYEDAYKNQREVMDYVNKFIKDGEEFAKNKSVSEIERSLRSNKEEVIHKEVTDKMIKKSEEYREMARKREERYKQKI